MEDRSYCLLRRPVTLQIGNLFLPPLYKKDEHSIPRRGNSKKEKYNKSTK